MIGVAAALALALASPPALECRAMRVAKLPGDVISEAESVAVACPPGRLAPKLRFDRRLGVAIARIELSEGEMLGRVYLPSRPVVLPGDTVRMEARIGHVIIQRDVTALQPARLRERFFARDPEGRILRAPRVAGNPSK